MCVCVCVCVCVCACVCVCVCVRFCVYILIFTIKEKYRHFVQLSNIKPKLAVCLKRAARSEIIIKGNAYLQPKGMYLQISKAFWKLVHEK